jgi:hypothetical protein
MKTQNDDPWKYATFEGVESLQLEQTAKMTFVERLEALDEMIRLAKQLQGGAFSVHEKQADYGNNLDN